MNRENRAVAEEEHYKAVGQYVPEGFQPPSQPQDLTQLPLALKIRDDYAAAKPAMLRFLAQRKRMALGKQMQIASRYNAEFERLHARHTGQ